MRNPDSAPRRYTSLAWAAALGHEETFEFLLSAGHDDEELSRVRRSRRIITMGIRTLSLGLRKQYYPHASSRSEAAPRQPLCLPTNLRRRVGCITSDGPLVL